MKDKFKMQFRGYGTIYTVTNLHNGLHSVEWDGGNSSNYLSAMVEKCVDNGSWVIVDEQEKKKDSNTLEVGMTIRQIRNFGRMFYPDSRFTVRSIMNGVAELSCPNGIGYIPIEGWKDYFEII